MDVWSILSSQNADAIHPLYGKLLLLVGPPPLGGRAHSATGASKGAITVSLDLGQRSHCPFFRGALAVHAAASASDLKSRGSLS